MGRLLGWIRRAGRSDLGRKSAATLAARALVVLIGIGTAVVVARVLGPGGRGLYAVAVAVGMIGAQFANLGLQSAGVYYVAADRSLLGGLVANALAVALVVGGGGALAAWAVFACWPDAAPVGGILLLLALASIPLRLGYLLFQKLLIGIQDVRAYNVIDVCSRALGLAMVAVVIWAGRATPGAVFAAVLAAPILGAGAALWRLRNHLRGVRLLPCGALFRRCLRYGMKAYLACLFVYACQQAGLLTLKYLRGRAAAGQYSVAVAVAALVYMLPTVVSMLLFPKLSSLKGHEVKWRITKQAAAVIGLLLVGVCAVTALLGKWLVLVLFGREYLAAVPAVRILMIAVPFLGVQTVCMQFLNSLGYPLKVVAAWGLCAALNVVANLHLVPLWGMSGAAVATCATYALALGLTLAIAFWELRARRRGGPGPTPPRPGDQAPTPPAGAAVEAELFE